MQNFLKRHWLILTFFAVTFASYVLYSWQAGQLSSVTFGDTITELLPAFSATGMFMILLGGGAHIYDKFFTTGEHPKYKSYLLGGIVIIMIIATIGGVIEVVDSRLCCAPGEYPNSYQLDSAQ